MSKFMLGAKAIKALVEQQNGMAWWKAKLSDPLFRGDETAIFHFVNAHYHKFKRLPKPETLLAQFPELADLPSPEVPAYYLDKLESRLYHETIGKANLASQDILKNDQDNWRGAEKVLRDALQSIAQQQMRHRITDFGQEGYDIVSAAYFKQHMEGILPMDFGWPYMDSKTGGVMPGDIVSFVGRPAQGKTWFLLYIALYNWMKKYGSGDEAQARKVLFVSMEMSTLAISQRLAAVYAGTNVTQLKLSAFGTDTQKHFFQQLSHAQNEEGKLYIVDGNLAAHVEEIYELAAHLGCHGIFIDGAYLMRHPNQRLNRFERVAENVEMMKRFSADVPTFASWQFNRQGAKKNKKAGEKESLEDIGYSDAIGQISSIVVGLMQEETVETIERRRADLLKGRNGETGGYDIHWDFGRMNFKQIGDETDIEPETSLDFV